VRAAGIDALKRHSTGSAAVSPSSIASPASDDAATGGSQPRHGHDRRLLEVLDDRTPSQNARRRMASASGTKRREDGARVATHLEPSITLRVGRRGESSGHRWQGQFAVAADQT
jgi:hypothetical protein